MNYRRLGRSGLKVSELSLGAWITFGGQVGEDATRECMEAAREAGVNFFDNAEVYARGNAERVMGTAIRKLKWRRSSIVVSTKFFWGLNEGPNEKNTLCRKYLLEAMEGSLERLGMSYVDLAFCHRPDPETPVEETVRAMHDLVHRAKAHYWGVSEWDAAQVREAYELAAKHHLHPPVTEQPQYNMFCRERVEQEYQPLYRHYGMGLTTWSPLASGLLSGKYNAGVPSGSRLATPSLDWLKQSVLTADRVEKVTQLSFVAKGLGCTMAQLALAWCLKNPNVSSVITGATRVEQVRENMRALEVVPRLTDEVMQRIEGVLTPAA
ncbi:MAG TPA: aldo/keto reductase [Candidatus Saccharimonadales bacterium]|nr:aldo/keto reductase [Candidatus Saccharimonadales bacterium]